MENGREAKVPNYKWIIIKHRVLHPIRAYRLRKLLKYIIAKESVLLDRLKDIE